MSALRFNAFAMIHKALRSMLYDAADDLQKTNFANPATTLPALGKVEKILELFDDHADHEDNMVLPMIHEFDQPLVDTFEAEHVTDRNLGLALHKSIAAYKEATIDADRIAAGNEVFYAFNEFIAFNLKHMNREETTLNQVIWNNYTDGDIMAVNQKIAASVPPEKAVVNFTWMLRACNVAEVTNLLKSLKANAPEPVFHMIHGLAKQELHADNFALVEQALNEVAMS